MFCSCDSRGPGRGVRTLPWGTCPAVRRGASSCPFVAEEPDRPPPRPTPARRAVTCAAVIIGSWNVKSVSTTPTRNETSLCRSGSPKRSPETSLFLLPRVPSLPSLSVFVSLSVPLCVSLSVHSVHVSLPWSVSPCGDVSVSDCLCHSLSVCGLLPTPLPRTPVSNKVGATAPGGGLGRTSADSGSRVSTPGSDPVPTPPRNMDRGTGTRDETRRDSRRTPRSWTSSALRSNLRPVPTSDSLLLWVRVSLPPDLGVEGWGRRPRRRDR